MTKKLKIGVVVGVVVVVLAGGYFVVVPKQQAKSYTNTAETKHAQLNKEVNELSNVLDSDTFVKTDLETSQVQADVKKGREAITEAEHTLNQVEKDLTEFKALPLLDWNSQYKKAKELKANEQKYIADTRAYINELKATLDFMEQSIEMQNELTEFTGQVALADQKSESFSDYAALLEAPVKKLEDTVNKFAALKAPESIKALYDYSVTATKEYVELQKQALAAAKAEDEAKLVELAIKEQEKLNEFAAQTDKLNSEFVKNSSLRKMSEGLKELNRTISDQLANV